MKILIVDDDPVAQLLIKEALSPLGQIDICNNGEEGLLAFDYAHETDQPYDLIILDIMMPVMDGMETLQAIRDRELQMETSLTKNVMIIVLSVKDEMRNVLECMAMGANDFLSKPIRPAALLDILEADGVDVSAARK